MENKLCPACDRPFPAKFGGGYAEDCAHADCPSVLPDAPPCPTCGGDAVAVAKRRVMVFGRNKTFTCGKGHSFDG